MFNLVQFLEKRGLSSGIQPIKEKITADKIQGIKPVEQLGKVPEVQSIDEPVKSLTSSITDKPLKKVAYTRNTGVRDTSNNVYINREDVSLLAKLGYSVNRDEYLFLPLGDSKEDLYSYIEKMAGIPKIVTRAVDEGKSFSSEYLKDMDYEVPKGYEVKGDLCCPVEKTRKEEKESAEKTAMSLAGILKASPAKQIFGAAHFKDPNLFYRVVHGNHAFQDILDSSLVRTNFNSKPSVPGVLSLGNRPTMFPSFSKGEASMSYAHSNPEHYIITSADPSLKPSNHGRHGKGNTMFPTDEHGNHLPSLDASKVQVYKHIGDENYELMDHLLRNAQKTAAADPSQTILITGHSGAGKTTFSSEHLKDMDYEVPEGYEVKGDLVCPIDKKANALVVSGIHGDEPAGNKAAQKLKDSADVVSDINPSDKRRFEGKDINRHFDKPTEGKVQKTILDIIRKKKPSKVIALHEDDEVDKPYAYSSESLKDETREALKDYDTASSAHGDKAEDGVISEGKNPAKGSLEKALDDRDIPRVTIETPSKAQNMNKRVETQLDVVKKLLGKKADLTNTQVKQGEATHELKSSNIKAVGYDKENKSMDVAFHSGGNYTYKDVPKSLFDRIKRVKSPGKFFHKHIKRDNSYKYDKMEKESEYKLHWSKDLHKDVTNNRHYPFSFLTGEAKELVDAIKNRDWANFKEEIGDSTYAAQMLAAQATGLNHPVYADLSKHYDREKVWKDMFKEKGSSYHPKHMQGGSNYAKASKIIKAFASAGIKVDQREAERLANKYTGGKMEKEASKQPLLPAIKQWLKKQPFNHAEDAFKHGRIPKHVRDDVVSGRAAEKYRPKFKEMLDHLKNSGQI
jgi:predicted deacylase/NTP pyrophosphatase (non-canonical NTP hydrolase)